jgi:dolichol-phosphate mannosyltransferase
MNVLVVLPTYNEAENIDHVLRRVRSSLADATVLVVDDGSPDGTAALAETIGKELGSIEILRRHDKSGLGSAYRAGFRWGLDHGFDACIEMDADLSPEGGTSTLRPCSDWVWPTRPPDSGRTPPRFSNAST